MTQRPNIMTIPAGQPFADCLADGLLAESGGDPARLSDMHILLPTRRAARALRDAFLRRTNGRPLLLPRLSPVGDVDEDELSLTLLALDEDFSLPPAISPLRRQAILAQLVARQGYGRGFEQDMALADALGRLMDQINTEGLDFADLPQVVDRDDFALHWQVSLNFLDVISKYWPAILAERDMMDGSARRDRLIRALANHWAKTPPQTRIIAAGSTGSIPATAALLKTIAHLPNGCVILPGLDRNMDEESWEAMDDTHPQAILRNILNHLDVTRADVGIYHAAQNAMAATDTIRAFTSEIMRPAKTSGRWQDAKERLALTRAGLPLHRYDCDTPQEEAQTIACLFRQVLEDPTRTAALITPDRRLARRVAMACRRWGIEIDDSAGRPLSETLCGTYLRLCIDAARADLRPVALLDFCKHAKCRPEDSEKWRSIVRDADKYLLRGPAFRAGLEAYRTKIAIQKSDGRKTDTLEDFIMRIETSFASLLALCASIEKHSFEDWLNAHMAAAEYFCAPDILWQGEDGVAAAQFLAELRDCADDLPPLNADDYAALIKTNMDAIAVRPHHTRHARLSILGQLEARMASADVMILGGLNEGTWPPAPAVDPWMSRPMRKRFKLPSPERSIGLAAHDFAQALCAGNIVLTRAKKTDGAPTVPSRWLQRMDTVLEACDLKDSLLDGDALRVARLLDYTADFNPVQRPEPRPPVAARPREISVTRVETWMNDPYGIYARYILRLRALDPLEQDLDSAMRGTLVHALLDRFVAQYPDIIPPDAKGAFLSIAREELDRLAPDPDIRTLWEPRLSRIGDWLVDHERTWRETMKPAAREIKGKMVFQGPAGVFTLTGIADRIDISRDGAAAAIIDYKSAGSFNKKGMMSGKYPQLPLEALILADGGFESPGAKPPSALSYWIVRGGREGGDVISLQSDGDLEKAMTGAHDGLQDLINLFDDERTPYYSLPRPDRAPRYNDYEHLARVREWTALDEAEEDTAA